MRIFTSNQIDEIYRWLLTYEKKQCSKEKMLYEVRGILLQGEEVKVKLEASRSGQ